MRNLVSPGPRLEIELLQIREGAGRKKRMADVLNGAFDSPFFVTTSRPARAGGEVIVRAQFQQARMKMDRIAAPFDHYRPQVVVIDSSHHASQVREGIDVAEQKSLQALIE